jgi:dolichol-phosphate mannosyltransferase
MTISRHTLHAINPRALSLRERAALVVQSRVHSRSGRRFAQLLTRTGLPVATINALAQWAIPPPKYSVQRLLPHAEVSLRARLHGIFLIERGATDETRQLGHDTAMEMLADNCEDAFGFPPYATLESRLRNRGGLDWREREREIVSAAFAGQPATLLSSDSFDWWRRIAASIERSTARTRRAALAVASA